MELHNHQLVLTDKGGFRVRGEVIEASDAISADGEQDLLLRTYDWLDFGTYPAVFTTPHESLPGSFEVWSSTLESNEDVVVLGRFVRDKKH